MGNRYYRNLAIRSICSDSNNDGTGPIFLTLHLAAIMV